MPNAYRPTLETHRLLLHPITASDFDALWLIFADPKVMAVFNSPSFDQRQMTLWFQRHLDHQTQYGYGLFSVSYKANGVLIGECGLETMELEGLQVVELGYDLRDDYWNQGLATESTTAVRDYALHVLHLPRLVSLIRFSNIASQRVAKKLEMKRLSEFSRNNIQYWKYGFENSVFSLCH